MVYSSYVFLFLFLPITLIGYFSLQNTKNKIYQRLFLILASLFFYGYNNIKYVPLIVLSVIVNYVIAKLIVVLKSKPFISKVCLVAGIIFNVLLLGYFKYYNFFIENMNAVLGMDIPIKKILLPLGISFFTFQQLSFQISIYKGEHKLGNFIDYSTFVTFFPQLVAGPIVIYNEIEPQLMDDSRRKFNIENFQKGLYMFILGMFKKVVVADTLSIFVDNGFVMTNLGFVTAWATVLSYTFQIYFDFSGYSDMAIGLGKMFNIDITYNFLSPYKSKSVSEFWRKWHITLGRALSTYIYIPLGGNRKGIVRTCINLFLTFLVSGIWHGAAWTFVLWGVLYGVLVVIERIFKKSIEKIPGFIRVCLVFLCVNLLWVLFRAENFAQVAEIYKGMLNFTSFDIMRLSDIVVDGIINFPTFIDIAYILGILTALSVIVFKAKNSSYLYENFTPFAYKTCLTSGVLFLISIVFMSRGSVFIYFNF